MLRLCRPVKPSASNPDGRDLDPEKYETLFQYCERDVAAQREIENKLPQLDAVGPLEQDIWELDAKINQRGIRVDRDSCVTIQDLIAEAKNQANAEIMELTGGEVNKFSETTSLKDWLNLNGVNCTSVAKAAVESMLQRDDLPEKARRVLELRQEAGLSSVAKYNKMLDNTEVDGYARGNLKYFGANTGRWSGSGIQLHNLPQGTIKEDPEVLVGDLTSMTYDELKAKYGNVLAACSSAIRPMFTADAGKRLLFADFSSIEARVLPWLAKDDTTLEMIRRGEDLYKELAKDIFRKPVDEITKDERQVGKLGVLGLGYSMGRDKFFESLKLNAPKYANYEMAEKTVDTYREKFEDIKKLWYGTERAAIRAFDNPGTTTSSGRIKFWRRSASSALYMILPSKRKLCFFSPEVGTVRTPWGQEKRQLSFMKQNSDYGMKFMRCRTYGGDLVQTATQATARDVMGEAMLRIDRKGHHDIMLTVHDEIVGQTSPRLSDELLVSEIEHLMTVNPKWAASLPIGAEAEIGNRYRK